MSEFKNLVCEQCVHEQCCAYKEAYDVAVFIMRDAFENLHGCDTSFMIPKDPECKLFLSNKYGTVNFRETSKEI